MLAGAKDGSGAYPADSLNGRVQAQLTEFAKRLQAFSRASLPEGADD
jgi:hypothetical protein